MKLVPREAKFYEFFLQQAQLTQEAAKLLFKAAQDGNASVHLAANDIIALERKGDEIVHNIFTMLNQTFITPLDPEDLHALGSHMDDVLDAIEEAAHRICAYKIDPIPPPVTAICDLIVQTADTLAKAFQALADDRDQELLNHCIEINRLEDAADQLTRTTISDLFNTEKDPIQLIKLKEVYDFLELATDNAEDVADALQAVVLKNG